MQTVTITIDLTEDEYYALSESLTAHRQSLYSETCRHKRLGNTRGAEACDTLIRASQTVWSKISNAHRKAHREGAAA